MTTINNIYVGDQFTDMTGEIEIEVLALCALNPSECCKVRILKCSSEMADIFSTEEGEIVEHFDMLSFRFLFIKLAKERIN